MGTAEDLPLADLPTRRKVLQKMMLEKLNDPRDYRNIPTMELTGKKGGVHFPVDTNKCQDDKSFAEGEGGCQEGFLAMDQDREGGQ